MFATITVDAQTNSKTVIHTIVQGETLSAIAKKYGTTVGDIMRLNGMNSTSVLKIGAKIKIPPAGKPVVATTTNTVTAKPPITKTVAPKPLPVSISAVKDSTNIMHTVAKGESLYVLGKKFNTTVSNLKTWNKLNTDAVKVGQVLIVGHTAKTIMSVVEKKETVPLIAEKKVDTLKNIVAVPKEEIKVPETKKSAPSASDVMVFDTVSIGYIPEKNIQKNDVVNTDASTGFFTSSFGADVTGRDLKTASGSAMIFTTSNATNDKKYYILMNDVPPGSIVKISSADKTVYAKVLWRLDNMKDNEGLVFRISDAAASALGIMDSKFTLSVVYYE